MQTLVYMVPYTLCSFGTCNNNKIIHFILYIYFIVPIIISLPFLRDVSLYVGFFWLLVLVYLFTVGLVCLVMQLCKFY